jgi:hypothetical protein
MEGSNKSKESIYVKKDIFIKSRKDDIRTVYEFSPKVPLQLKRFWVEEPMESSTRLALNSRLILIGWSSLLPKSWLRTHRPYKTKSKSSRNWITP